MSSIEETKGGWLKAWDPEDPKLWDSKLAWTTLSITTFSLTLAFVAWFLPSAIIPKLDALGYAFSGTQLYWMAAMPGLSGGILRIIWMVLPPIQGTRVMVVMTTLLLLLPILGWGIEITNPDAPYWRLMMWAFFAGIGGGAFSGFMPSTSYFFPRKMQGTALGIQAGVGNFGVSLVQLLTPWLITLGMFGFLGSQQMAIPGGGGETVTVWYQDAALIYVPFILIAAIWGWFALKSVPVKANIKQQFDIFSNQDTWWMTFLYILTFGTFSGLSAQFGLLMRNLYGVGNEEIVSAAGDILVAGYSVPDPVKFVFLGPLVGAGARILFSPLTDKMGGAVWTFISSIGIAGSVLFTITALTPDVSSAAALDAGFTKFLWGMLAIFLFSGIGNASTFKQMPMIFNRRQAGGVIGWTAAIAAFGPFLFGVGISTFGAVPFYWFGVAFAIVGAVITWFRYAKPGAPKPG